MARTSSLTTAAVANCSFSDARARSFWVGQPSLQGINLGLLTSLVQLLQVQAAKNFANATRINLGPFDRSCFGDIAIAFLRMNYQTRKRRDIRKNLGPERVVADFLVAFFTGDHTKGTEKGQMLDSFIASKVGKDD